MRPVLIAAIVLFSECAPKPTKAHAFFAYSGYNLIDLKASTIMNIEPTGAFRQAEGLPTI